MANIRVKARLQNIESELEKIDKHIRMYSGIAKADAAYIVGIAGRIAKMAVEIENEADRVLLSGKPRYPIR